MIAYGTSSDREVDQDERERQAKTETRTAQPLYRILIRLGSDEYTADEDVIAHSTEDLYSNLQSSMQRDDITVQAQDSIVAFKAVMTI